MQSVVPAPAPPQPQPYNSKFASKPGPMSIRKSDPEQESGSQSPDYAEKRRASNKYSKIEKEKPVKIQIPMQIPSAAQIANSNLLLVFDNEII